MILYTTCGIIQYRGQGQRPDGAVDGSHANRGRVQCLSSHNICRPSPTVLSAFMQSPRSLHPFLRTPLLSPQRAAGILFAYRNNVLCICANCVELELYKRNWVPAGLYDVVSSHFDMFAFRLYSPHRLFPGPVVHIKGCGCFCFRSFFVCIRACTKDRHWL